MMEIHGVRVDPPVIKFNDVQVGQVYKTKVTATNVGTKSKKISFRVPSSKVFEFTKSSDEYMVVPGLNVIGFMVYSPKTLEHVRGSLIIDVDTDSIEVPILVYPQSCCLIMEPDLDFGCVAATNEIISKSLPILNSGSAPGMFKVQGCEDTSVKISPISGLVAAGATQWISVELRTDTPTGINQNVVVKLQDRSPVILNVRAKVVDQSLEIYDLQGRPLSCIWFKPAYFGTSCIETIVLRNNAPLACDWVCVLLDSVPGTELGTDLQMCTATDIALLEKMQKCSVSAEVAQVFMCSPSQGRLAGYEKTTVTLCFSPIYKRSDTDTHGCYSSKRQDYRLFFRFESIGSKHGFTHKNATPGVELAVTGSGYPVSLVPSPSETFDFLTCNSGQSVDRSCVLQNFSPLLPVSFSFRKLPHFSAKPSAGTIAPGNSKNLIISFNPRQQGTFNVIQKIDLLGQVRQKSDCNHRAGFEGLQRRTFHTINLRLSASCSSKTTHPTSQLKPDITPLLNNPTGKHPYVRSTDMSFYRKIAPVAILCADKTKLHKHSTEKTQSCETQFVAFPNDRAQSLRPSSPNQQYRTIFTGVPRYRNIDSSYAFTKEEAEKRAENWQGYADLIHNRSLRRLQRQQQKRQEQFENEIDIGIEPSQDLVPLKLFCKDLKQTNACSNFYCKDTNTSRELKSIRKCSGILKAVPSTSQEVAECDRSLTPQELYQITIEPLSVDFGEVCVRSVCTQRLDMMNHLSVHVWVQLEVDCPELQGSSPISYILPPQSHSALTLTFQSGTLGEFNGTVPYTVNNQHRGQILVQAQVVPVALVLSTELLLLHPSPAWFARSGYRGVVTIKNHRNHSTKFTWKPVITQSGIQFSIRPASGVVDAYTELDCEVVWHSGFNSPLKGQFDLCVHEGNTLRLNCVAKLGCTTVQLTKKTRVTFESVPLNMTSIKTAVLRNTGPNHAFYQVLNACPLPGMVVSPAEGLVPRGGHAIISIQFNPDCVIKFDARIEIALKGMESIMLRVGGMVETPNVEISANLQLFGVYLGSRRCVPLTLTNHSSAPARVTFDLSEYAEFSVHQTEPSAGTEPGVSVVEIEGHQKANCSLIFCPKQVASYYFELPMTVNGMVSSSPCQLSFPSSPATSSTSCSLTSGYSKATVQHVPRSVSIATGSRSVVVTVIYAPLEMSPSSLHFDLTPLSDSYTKIVVLKAAPEESTCWVALMHPVSWWIDCSGAESCVMDKTNPVCSVSPSSGTLKPDQSICVKVTIRSDRIQRVSGGVTKLTLPVYLGEKGQDEMKDEQRYRELSITLHHLPHITVQPPQLLLTPVPLGCSMTVTLTLVAMGYSSGTDISAVVSDVELENGRKQQPLSLSFPQGTQIPAQDQNKTGDASMIKKQATSLTCNVSFCSQTPISLSSNIIFIDHFKNRFEVKVWAVADNCLLTVWPYVALHRSKQQIVLKAGATAFEAILQDFHVPSVGSFSSSSTSGLCGSIKKPSCADSFLGSAGFSEESSSEQVSSCDSSTRTNCGIPEFLTSKSEVGLFYQSVLISVERWFSLFGWANGPYPVLVPQTLRRVESKIHTNNPNENAPSTGSRSVVDLLAYLTGVKVPGVPHTISNDLNHRTTQLIQLYKTILDFLGVQGAHLCYIKPEYLLDENEFKHWCSLQEKESVNSIDFSCIDYESMSKRSWTDLLLQIYKVFILCRVSGEKLSGNSSQTNTNKGTPTCLQQLPSNIYSPGELQLLSWLNMHYETMRRTVWIADATPPGRWIVNFDLDLADGLVLAAVLAAYCPYLICSHFGRMRTKPSSLEEILHNNIIVVQALTTLSLNMDIIPTDISNPNPVQMLMLCVHLNKKLPQYQLTQTIILSGELHSTISKQIHLTSPTPKPVKYKALLLGEDAHLFSLPGGLSYTISPKGTELTIWYSCAFLQPKEAALLLLSSTSVGAHGTLAFHLKTCVTHIAPLKTVKCSATCYKPKLIPLRVTNTFKSDGNFKIILEESVHNPLEPQKQNDSQHAISKSNPLFEKMTERKSSDPHYEEVTEFSCAVKSCFLSSGEEQTLDITYLPFSPGSRYCCVLFTSSQIGDMVYMVRATTGLPSPMPLFTKPSEHIDLIADDSTTALRLQCKAGQVCKEVICLPIINFAWEQALAFWGQNRMSAEEHKRRSLTHTLNSSSVRRVTALNTFRKQQASENSDHRIIYSIEVSSPQYFTLPCSVTIPVNDSFKMQWENLADCGCVEIPLQFKADSVGTFTCKMVLRSWCDTRVYMLEAMVTAEVKSAHLDLSTPAHQSVTQNIPFLNEGGKDMKIKAEVCGKGFSGPDGITVAAGTKACYPLTFHPVEPETVMGKLTFHNECRGAEHIFTLRGVGVRPLPVDHLLLHCSVGKITVVHLDVPNYSKSKVTLKMKTDVSMISGPAYVEIKPEQTEPCRLIISPTKRGTYKGCVSFVEVPQHENESSFEVYFTLEIICEAAEPLKNLVVQCPIQSHVTIEIPVHNPHDDRLDLDVFLEGHGLSGSKSLSLPSHSFLNYYGMFSPCVVGKSPGSVVFQSEMGGEFWYQLELYALPLPVVKIPEVECDLGKSTKLTLPLVNPTSEPVELTVSNSNPRNYSLEMESNILSLEPHSSSQLGVRFSPSTIGEENHKAEITFSCPQLQQWTFALSGRGLHPECEQQVSIMSQMGTSTSITISFTNPTEHQAVLHISVSDEYPNVTHYMSGVFMIPFSQLEGVQMEAGASIDIPVVFTPTSMETRKAWLHITLGFSNDLGISSICNAHAKRSAQDLSTICWIYPLCGIPTEVHVESPSLGLIQCEAGCQLEKKVDVVLAGCLLENQVTKEDFQCEILLEDEKEQLKVEDSFSVFIETGTRDCDTGVIKVTLNLIFRPLEPWKNQCHSSVIVKCVSGGTWEFPVSLKARKPVSDDVIDIEATEIGQTSVVGFRLTSTTRSPEPFSAVLVQGSSSEFTVSPTSGMLPPVTSNGVLITVSFTPSSNSSRSRARLQIKAADLKWIYKIEGRIQPNKPQSSLSQSSALSPPLVAQKNFVVRNLRIPGLANSSPLKIHR